MKEKTSLLEVIPFRSAFVTTEQEGDCVVIAFPRFHRQWMRRLFLPKGMSADIHIRLEEHGTAVWNLIDGKRTVGEIIEKLAAHFQGEASYESRVMTYLYQLHKDKLIKWALHRF
ncbi:MAG: PqqD family protein [Bacteroides sp.]